MEEEELRKIKEWGENHNREARETIKLKNLPTAEELLKECEESDKTT